MTSAAGAPHVQLTTSDPKAYRTDPREPRRCHRAPSSVGGDSMSRRSPVRRRRRSHPRPARPPRGGDTARDRRPRQALAPPRRTNPGSMTRSWLRSERQAFHRRSMRWMGSRSSNCSCESPRARGWRSCRAHACCYDIPASGPISGRIQESFASAVKELNPDTRRVLLLAAADPTGDATLLRRATMASALEIPRDDDDTVALLITFAPSVRFRHPLVRSAIYSAATDADRRAAHLALAQALTSEGDPDPRVWHLARSLDGPDEQIAEALERPPRAHRHVAGGPPPPRFYRARRRSPQSRRSARVANSTQPSHTFTRATLSVHLRCCRPLEPVAWTIDSSLTRSFCADRSTCTSPVGVTRRLCCSAPLEP